MFSSFAIPKNEPNAGAPRPPIPHTQMERYQLTEEKVETTQSTGAVLQPQVRYQLEVTPLQMAEYAAGLTTGAIQEAGGLRARLELTEQDAAYLRSEMEYHRFLLNKYSNT